MSNGHVFVVQGRMENLDSDAVILATDRYFSVSGHWAPTLGLPDAGFGEAVRTLQPDGWSERRWGRATATGPAEPPKPTWFVDVASYFSRSLTEDLDDVMARLRRVLAEVARLDPGQGRSHVLVSMPLLGTGHGGFGPNRGQVIDTQLRVCREESAALGIDIVIVANSTSDYTALQERRRELGSGDALLTPELRAAAERLAAVARSGELALFLGAGVSIGAGLPSWNSLLGSLAEGKDVDLTQLSSTLDRAELLRIKYGADFGAAIAAQVTHQRRYAMTHAILAALGCREVVTTNYDRLYELAAGDVQANAGVAVLPFDRAQQDRPWVLKMHGDAERPETIISPAATSSAMTPRHGRWARSSSR
nr:SIR2 family protein [Occultella kanbiaonis]